VSGLATELRARSAQLFFGDGDGISLVPQFSGPVFDVLYPSEMRNLRKASASARPLPGIFCPDEIGQAGAVNWLLDVLSCLLARVWSNVRWNSTSQGVPPST